MKFPSLIMFIVLLNLFSSCGKSLIPSKKSDPAEDATIALENDDAPLAIEILEKAIEDDSDNPKLISILSLAYAQKAKVEPLGLVTALVKNETTSNSESDTESDTTSDSNMFTALFAIMPDPTEQISLDINKAVSLLTAVPSADRIKGDNFKLAMFQTAAVVIQIKFFDSNLDGEIKSSEIKDLSAAQAAAILNNLDSAESLISNADMSAEDKEKALESFSKFKEDLDTSAGDSQEDKLKNYLASK